MSHDLEEIKRRLEALEKRVANQERNHGLLVAVLTLALVVIVVLALFI